MKIRVFLFIVFITYSSFAQIDTKDTNTVDTNIKFNGNIWKVEAKTSNYYTSMFDLYLYLNFEIINNGNQDIILPTNKIGCDYIKFKKTSGENIGKISFLKYSYFLKWEDLTDTFDKKIPPKTKTTIIKKGKRLEYKTFFTLEVALDKNEKVPIIPYPENLTFNNLKGDSPVYIQFECSAKPIEALSKYKDHDIDQFWNKLRIRWKNYGFLFTEKIISEPIILDLSNTIIKSSGEIRK